MCVYAAHSNVSVVVVIISATIVEAVITINI